MSRNANAVLSGVSSFAVAYLVGSAVRDRRAGVRFGLVAAVVAGVVSWVVSAAVETAQRRHGPANPSDPVEAD